MKDIKTRSSEKTPRILSSAARAPKELAKKFIIEAKEKAKDVAQRQQPQEESPEQYAENRMEQAAEETVYRAGDEVFYRGRQTVQRIKDAKRQKDRFEQQKNTTSHSSSEGNAARQSDSTASRRVVTNMPPVQVFW